MPRPAAWGLFAVLTMLAFCVPAAAKDTPRFPTLSVGERLEDRRYVTTGTRAYEVGTEESRFPAMGFHTRGEMGGSGLPP